MVRTRKKILKILSKPRKSRAIQGQVLTVSYNDKEKNVETEINNHIYSFFNYLYKETLSFSSNNLETYLNTILFPKLTTEKFKTLDGRITEKELLIALHIVKTDSNKINRKKGRGKRYIQSWRPISLLNVDIKLISKALAERLKNVLPEIISPNQNAYVKNRCISEGGRLISDPLEMSEVLNKEDFLVTIDIEKVFDSVNHHFLIAMLEKIGFGTEIIEWIKVLLNNQEFCVINIGKTSKYFKLERGTRQGDPISAYLFIIVLEVVFRIIKETSNIKGFEIFQKKFIYTGYVDDTTFFLKNTESVINLLEIFKHFSQFSGLKPNKSNVKWPAYVF